MIYSTRFLGQFVAAGGTADYTVPAGHIAVIRDVVIAPESAGGYSYVAVISGGSTMYILNEPNPPVSPGTLHWKGRQILQPGDILEFGAPITASFVAISGYLLTT